MHNLTPAQRHLFDALTMERAKLKAFVERSLAEIDDAERELIALVVKAEGLPPGEYNIGGDSANMQLVRTENGQD